MRLALLTLTALVCGTTASAEDAPLCSDRPSKATPSRVVAPGAVPIEISAINWAHHRTNRVRSGVKS